MSELAERLGRYNSRLWKLRVAFSAGVDSTVVAKAARLALGDRAIAVTGVSDSLAAGELNQARELAQLIGIRHEVISTSEMRDPNYLKNDSDRCYHCKTELYQQIEPLAEKLNLAVIVNGANLDDHGDYRPGMTAAAEHEVRSPRLNAASERAAFAHWPPNGLFRFGTSRRRRAYRAESLMAKKSPPSAVAMIDQAECFLRSLGLKSRARPGTARPESVITAGSNSSAQFSPRGAERFLSRKSTSASIVSSHGS